MRLWANIFVSFVSRSEKASYFKMLLRTHKFAYLSCRYISVLGRDSKKLFVQPLLDYENRLNNPSEIAENINRRCLSPMFNVEDLLAQWELYNTFQDKQNRIKERRKSAGKELEAAKSLERSQERESMIRKSSLEEKLLQQHLDTLQEKIVSVKDALTESFLSIPNVISANTPDQPRVQSVGNGDINKKIANFHLEASDQIEYFSKHSYFLMGNAAKVDTFLPLLGAKFFKSHNFVQFSNPDFARAVIAEAALSRETELYNVDGCDESKSFNQLHLVGGCSFLSFLSMLTRSRVYGTLLPFRWIATGRSYDPLATGHHGLYDACQSTCLQVFLAEHKNDTSILFAETLEIIRKFYDAIGMHYRIVEMPANELELSACYSVRIEMFSAHLQKYIEVGRLSDYSDFISKRLMFFYEADKKRNICEYPRILGGRICNITRLIAIALEANEGIMPSQLLSNKTLLT